MKRSLRTELLLSHLILIGLMLLLVFASVVGFLRLGRSVDRILRDNYKSVIAAQNMKESLERQDSAATFFLAGQTARARAQYAANRPLFEKAYAVEAGNVTEEGEQDAANEIKIRYTSYRHDMERLLYANPPVPARAANTLYFGTLETEFVLLKNLAQHVLDLNQAAIVRAAARARRESERATAISLTVAAGSTLLGLLFTARMIREIMNPIVSLTRQADEIGAGHLDQRIETRRDDEIGQLSHTFNTMTERLRVARQKDEDRFQRAERMSDAALENLYDPVIVTDPEGKVVHLNRAAEGLFGPDAVAKGRDVGVVVRNNRLYAALRRANGMQETSADEGDAALTTFGERTYRLRATPMQGDDAKTLGAVAVLEDVTYQREVDRLKTEFIGVASHELRTPVTSLLLGVQLLREGAVGMLSPDQKEVADALQTDLERMERMMHDLLDITRLEAGATPPRLQIVSAPELITGARQAVELQAVAKGVSLKTVFAENTPRVRADRAQITRVLINLLNNAIRHTPSGGTITLEVKPPSGNRVPFSVSDTGSGIPREYLEAIFDRFVQVPGATKGGSGLGLSLAKNIVRAHGGEMHAESGVGAGSTFTFTLAVATSGDE